MVKPLIAGNWKMNGSAETVPKLIAGLKAIENPHMDIVVFPPAVFIPTLVSGLQNSRIRIGAQNAHTEASGAYTGEIAAIMFAESGCDYVLAGHSERRQGLGESNQLVADKCQAALAARLTPVLCVGETASERQQGRAQAIVGEQLAAVLTLIGAKAFQSVIVAYEPVWAVGTGEAANTETIADMHSFLRNWLVRQIGQLSQSVRLLYGGSVNTDNASEILSQPDVNGALIGGASLDVATFSGIIDSVPVANRQ